MAVSPAVYLKGNFVMITLLLLAGAGFAGYKLREYLDQ